MKKLVKRSLFYLMTGILIIVPISCQSVDDLDVNHANIDENNVHATTISSNMLSDVPIPTAPVVADELPVAVDPDFALGVATSPLADPEEFARSVFDESVNVAPWHANYVGSYGILPARAQAEGPFLYSHDISEDADIFHDDDLDPFDKSNFSHDDDDCDDEEE